MPSNSKRPLTSSGPYHFGVVGTRHSHVMLQAAALADAGAVPTMVWEPNDESYAEFAAQFPAVERVAELDTILQSDKISFVTAAPIAAERASLGIRCLDAGKDYLVDKPGVLTRAELADVQEAVSRTGRRFVIWFHERLTSRATDAAVGLVRSGAIGDLVHATILAPHQARPAVRPDWFWDPALAGNIIEDLGSHHFDLLLEATNNASLEVTSAVLDNVKFPERDGFFDLATITVTGERFQASIQLDWLSPDELGTWGDGRVFFRGTTGYLEVRREIDIAGEAGSNHVLLVNQDGIQRHQYDEHPLPFASNYLKDLASGENNAMTSTRWSDASSLALDASELSRLNKTPGNQ